MHSNFNATGGFTGGQGNLSNNWGAVLLCCWPGLPGLWYRGRWSSLALAIGFSILLNLTVVASFVWTGTFQDESFPAIAWPVVLLVWFCTTVLARRNLPDVMSLTAESDSIAIGDESEDAVDTLFIDARREYLRGHWEEALGLLSRQLKHRPRDIESRLMLATMFRHTRKFDEAATQLDHIQRYDPAVFWKDEIERERELLKLVHDFEMSSELEQETTNNDGIIRTVA